MKAFFLEILIVTLFIIFHYWSQATYRYQNGEHLFFDSTMLQKYPLAFTWNLKTAINCVVLVSLVFWTEKIYLSQNYMVIMI